MGGPTTAEASDVSRATDDDLVTRRRRAAYRAHHRGTKEMDWLVGRYADAHLEGFGEEALGRFERFLEQADPELQKWILEPELAQGSEFLQIVTAIRAFHGLKDVGAA